MDILLLSAYEAHSHHQWRLGMLEQLKHHNWTCLTLPPRYFSWRIRGSSLYWSQSHELNKDYDLLIATSMVDLATLRGLVPMLSRIPNLLYFHENQFAYPVSEKQHASVEPQMVTLYAALSADRLLFNTQYNLNTFVEGVNALLTQFPDYVPEGVAEGLAEKAQVLPVPLADDWFIEKGVIKDKQVHEVIWNHRWEYDKGPERLLRLVEQLPDDLPLRWHIVGQSFRQQPACFATLRERLQKREWLGQWGYIEDKDQYQQLLQSCDTVVSTSLHDFQGLSVLEAMASGCQALVPDRLAYPEFVPRRCRYKSDLDNEQEEAQAAAALLQQRLANENNTSRANGVSVQRYSWQEQAPFYEEQIQKAVAEFCG